MTTRLTRPVERLVRDKQGTEIVIALDLHGITFRKPRTPRRSALVLPYGVANLRAAQLEADRVRDSRGVVRRRNRSLLTGR